MSLSSQSGGADAASESNKVKLFLLKTESTPHDVYKDYFSTPGRLNGSTAAPVFVPVLEHTLLDDGLNHVRQLLRKKKINAFGEEGTYGGAIFTSQRAVEAFAKLVAEGIQPPLISSRLSHEHSTNILTEPQTEASDSWPHMNNIPVYTVGPATSLALRSIPAKRPLQIFGSDCGNGEALAHYMLDHYSTWHSSLQARTGKLPPVLFLVGETRRDIIPKTLMNPELPVEKHIRVDEVEVYGTGVMESFYDSFVDLLESSNLESLRWVIIFSPTGCEAALLALGILDLTTKKVKKSYEKGNTHVATIGPTTRDYLIKEFGYTPDVVAKKPSPEGIAEAISAYMEERGGSSQPAASSSDSDMRICAGCGKAGHIMTNKKLCPLLNGTM